MATKIHDKKRSARRRLRKAQHWRPMSKTAENLIADERRAQSILLSRLRDADGPLRPEDLFAVGVEITNPIPPIVIRDALWNLVRANEVEFTPEWAVRLKANGT